MYLKNILIFFIIVSGMSSDPLLEDNKALLAPLIAQMQSASEQFM